VAKKGKKAKKSVKAAKKSKKTAHAPKKSSRKTARRAAAPKKTAKKAAPHKKTAAKKPPASRKSRPERAEVVPAAAPTPPIGEVYGEEAWGEEVGIAAGELEADAGELEELEDELGQPEVGETEEDGEW
jgi:hypothetical protein